jgi:hypothetical protein
MKILLITVLTVLLTANLASSQTMRGAGFVGFSNQTELANYGVQEFIPKSEIKGSSLLFATSRVGVVTFKNDSKTEEVKLNYDSYNEFVVVETEGKTFAFPVKYVDTILFQDAVLGFNNCEVVFDTENTEYFLGEILNLGGLRLIKRQITTLKEPTYNAALDSGDRDSKFINSIEYYFLYEGKSYKLPKRKGKAINDGYLNSEIRKSLKSSKVNFNNEASLIDFVNSFNANN